MSTEQIRKVITNASQLVNSWPEWKQNILVHSSQPSVTTPRMPVNNQHGSSQEVRSDATQAQQTPGNE